LLEELYVNGDDQEFVDTSRDMCILEIIKTLLRDPDLLLVNVRQAPDDSWMRRVFVVLNLWQAEGGMTGLLQVLESAISDEEGDENNIVINPATLQARLSSYKDETKLSKREVLGQRTLIVLPHSAERLQKSKKKFGFSHVIQLVNKSTCLVFQLGEPAEWF
jgi:hypothetical protein